MSGQWSECEIQGGQHFRELNVTTKVDSALVLFHEKSVSALSLELRVPRQLRNFQAT